MGMTMREAEINLAELVNPPLQVKVIADVIANPDKARLNGLF